MERFGEGFWLVLLFNLCFLMKLFREGRFVWAVVLAMMLMYITPRYIKFLWKRRI